MCWFLKRSPTLSYFWAACKPTFMYLVYSDRTGWTWYVCALSVVGVSAYMDAIGSGAS